MGRRVIQLPMLRTRQEKEDYMEVSGKAREDTHFKRRGWGRERRYRRMRGRERNKGDGTGSSRGLGHREG